MKKSILTAFTVFAGIFSIYAQPKTVITDFEYQNTQARVLEPVSSAYVKPTVVELMVDSVRFEHTFTLERSKVEVSMRGDLEEIRSWGLYMASEEASKIRGIACDIIVAAMFNLEFDKSEKDYKLKVVGYPARFANWATASQEDYEWIKMDKTYTTNEKDKMAAIIK
ncbi:MAG: hypothetical protein LIO79_00750 [Rikenellaceae bacterium]|nr:hypothetical protein [Rikenellaceae bacterium]